VASRDEPEGTKEPESTEAAAEVDVRSELLAPEASLGSSAQGRSASACMRALARASRAYLIYDPSNEVIKTFLAEVQRSIREHLANYDELDLQVRPFELVLGDEVVYRETDWERSLSFKLFRDGVRRLTIGSGATWPELVQFLAILSIRYVGVSLDEDDVLTLLWKASFKHIDIEAVEGFVPTDDEDEPDLAAGGASVRGFFDGFASTGEGARAPADFDLPAPNLEWEEPPSFQAVSEDARVALRDEYGSRQLPRDLVQLVGALMTAIENPADLLSIEEAVPFLTEVRDFLLNEEEVSLLLKVARRIARGWQVMGRGASEDRAVADRAALDGLVDGFTSLDALRRILATVPDSAASPSDAYEGLLELHRHDPLQTLFDLLEVERSATARRFTRQLIERRLPERVDDVIARFSDSKPAVAADLLRVLASGAEEESRTLLNDVVHRGASEVKLEFLSQMGRVMSGNQRAFLVLLLSAPEEEVRVRALDVVGGLGERGGWAPVHRQLDHRVADGSSNEELDALGRALARIDPDRAVLELLPVVGKKRLFHSFRPKDVRARRAAVAAMCQLVDRPESRLALEQVASKEDECAELARAALGPTEVEAPPPPPIAPPRAPKAPRRPPLVADLLRPPPTGTHRTVRSPRPGPSTSAAAAEEAPWESAGSMAAVPQGGHGARAQAVPRAVSRKPEVDVPLVSVALSSEFEFELEDDE
jgi:hypothetical protein